MVRETRRVSNVMRSGNVMRSAHGQVSIRFGSTLESQPAKLGTWGEASVESVLSKCPDGYEARTLPAKTSHAVKVKAS